MKTIKIITGILLLSQVFPLLLILMRYAWGYEITRRTYLQCYLFGLTISAFSAIMYLLIEYGFRLIE